MIGAQIRSNHSTTETESEIEIKIEAKIVYNSNYE